MTKQDIIDRLAGGIGLAKPEVQAVVDGFLSVVMNTVATGDRVELRKFGVWKPVVRKGRHLKTPDGAHEVDVPDRATAVFVPASEFRDKMSKLQVHDIPKKIE